VFESQPRAELLAVLLDQAGDKDMASRILGALRESSDVGEVSMDDRLAIERALEKCPGDMVELRARLRSEPHPTWRPQASTTFPPSPLRRSARA